MILSTAFLCLALNVYHEARGEPLDGQHAVAQVTMNRAGRDPRKVCQVVTEPRQFSWTTGLTKKVRGRVVLKKAGEPRDDRAWMLAKHVANITLKGWVEDFTKGSTFYHAKTVRPQWSRSKTRIATYGRHHFYA